MPRRHPHLTALYRAMDMTFWPPQAEAVLAQICDLLQRQGRMSYWALQRHFDLNDNDLKGLKVELIEARQAGSHASDPAI